MTRQNGKKHTALNYTRTRRHNESADEFAENLKHLCLYPSTGLQNLIGACVRFETHVELGARSYKPNEGMYAVRGNNSTELSFVEVARAARKLGFQLRPWVERQE